MAKNIRRRGIVRNNDGIMKMIVCRVGGEMADGCKVWYEIDPKTDEYLDNGGNSVTYNYDPYIKDTSVIIPVSDSISGRPMKYRSAVTTTGTDGSGNTVGYVTITVAETIPANFNIGVLVINR